MLKESKSSWFVSVSRLLSLDKGVMPRPSVEPWLWPSEILCIFEYHPWKECNGSMWREKLAPRYIGPINVTTRSGEVAYQLELPAELSDAHNVIHVSQLQKCLEVSDQPNVFKHIEHEDTQVTRRQAIKIPQSPVDQPFRGRSHQGTSRLSQAWIPEPLH